MDKAVIFTEEELIYLVNLLNSTKEIAEKSLQEANRSNFKANMLKRTLGIDNVENLKKYYAATIQNCKTLLMNFEDAQDEGMIDPDVSNICKLCKYYIMCNKGIKVENDTKVS